MSNLFRQLLDLKERIAVTPKGAKRDQLIQDYQQTYRAYRDEQLMEQSKPQASNARDELKRIREKLEGSNNAAIAVPVVTVDVSDESDANTTYQTAERPERSLAEFGWESLKAVPGNIVNFAEMGLGAGLAGYEALTDDQDIGYGERVLNRWTEDWDNPDLPSNQIHRMLGADADLLPETPQEEALYFGSIFAAPSVMSKGLPGLVKKFAK